jgi:hypothetical protein
LRSLKWNFELLVLAPVVLLLLVLAPGVFLLVALVLLIALAVHLQQRQTLGR